MKEFIKKLISLLTSDIKRLEKEKKELETLKKQEKEENFYREHEKKRELFGYKKSTLEKDEIELSSKDKYIFLFSISLLKLFYIFLSILIISWVFTKLHISIKIVEVLIGLFTVMYFHIEIKSMKKNIIYSSTWIQYILAFLIPSIFYIIGYIIISFNSKFLQIFLLHKFYIDKLNYIGIGVVFSLTIFIRTVVYTTKKFIYSIKMKKRNY